MTVYKNELMNLNRRIEAFAKLGLVIKQSNKEDLIRRAISANNWFTPENINFALNAIANEMLNKESLIEWMKDEQVDSLQTKTVALILAGNIPAVGWHDILSVLILGLKAQIKLSSKDSVLIKYLINHIIEIEPLFKNQVEFVEKPVGFDAIIATGSNNSSLYFKHYFSKYPHIIRSNRKSIGIIFNDTSKEDIKKIGEDIFTHFGLGCRNISKLFIEDGVKLEEIMEILHDYKEINMHNKYRNNYDYNYTISLLNKDNFLMNGAMLLLENDSIHSRIATVHYELFSEIESVKSKIADYSEDIQCIVSPKLINDLNIISPGKAQSPKLNDYADNINTIEFLKGI